MKQTQKVLGPDQCMQKLQLKKQLLMPDISCTSNKEKVIFLCRNKDCNKPALHCQSCKECEVHLEQNCKSYRLKQLTFLLNMQNERKNSLVEKMMQAEAQMTKQLQRCKESMLGMGGFSYLNKRQVRTLKSIFNKSGKKVDIFGKDIDMIVKKVQRANEVFANHEQELLKIYRATIDRLTLELLELQRKTMGAFFGGLCSLDSQIISKDAFLEKEFILQSLRFHHRPKQLYLKFRASKNNFLAAKLHESCNWTSNTLTIIKTQYDKIIAGYTPFYLYNFDKKLADSRLKSCLLSVSMKKKMPIRNAQSIALIDTKEGGLIFGNYDLVIGNRCNSTDNSKAKLPQSYDFNQKDISSQEFNKLFTGHPSGKFRVKEYQVFQVIW